MINKETIEAIDKLTPEQALKILLALSKDMKKYSSKPKESIMGSRYLIRKQSGIMIAEVINKEELDGRKFFNLKVTKSTVNNIDVDSELTMSEAELKYYTKLKSEK